LGGEAGGTRGFVVENEVDAVNRAGGLVACRGVLGGIDSSCLSRAKRMDSLVRLERVAGEEEEGADSVDGLMKEVAPVNSVGVPNRRSLLLLLLVFGVAVEGGLVGVREEVADEEVEATLLRIEGLGRVLE